MEDLPAGFIIPTVVVAADIHVVSPEQLRQGDKWPDFKSIVNATDHDIKEHAWFQLRAQPRVDRGRAVDDDQDVERFGSPADMEVDKDSDAEVVKDSMAKAVSTPLVLDQARQSSQVRPTPVELLDLTAPHPMVVVVAVRVGQRNGSSWQQPLQLTMRMTPNPWQSVLGFLSVISTRQGLGTLGYLTMNVAKGARRGTFVVPSTLAARAGNALAQSWLAARRLSFERSPQHDRRPGVHQLVV